MSSAAYRPDIDGLRSIAVMSVVLFHADISFFSGGFAGVDVFFVISGFLITRLIKTALEDNRFSYGDFYLRRSRRLFPALFVTLLLVWMFGALLFLPSHFERLGAALISALFWCSNVFFWTETGYFDADAALKPLLHTWSLGVEEQFYLVWPTFLVLLFSWRKAALLPGIAIASVASFVASQYFLSHDASAAFYLMPFRVFEFGVGALLVWVVHRQPKNPVVLDGLLLLGIGIVVYSFIGFDEHVPFPGVFALVPCVGTALIIYAGQARLAGPILCNPVSIYLGVISYSLYLVHWPVVVFYKYVVQSFGTVDKLAVVVIAIALAGLMYRYIETPLRRPPQAAANKADGSPASPRKFIYGCLFSALALSGVSAGAWMTKGWPERWDLDEAILDAVTNQRELRDRSWDLVNNIGGLNEPEFTAVGPDSTAPKKVRLLLAGDSFSKDFFNALVLNEEAFDWLDVRRIEMHQYCLYLLEEGRPPPSDLSAEGQTHCEQDVAEWRASTLPQTADWVAYVVRWKASGLNDLPALTGELQRNSNARLALVGRKAEFVDVPRMTVRYGGIDGLDRYSAQFRKTAVDSINEELKALSADAGAPFVDMLAVACTPDGLSCDMVDDNGKLLFYDYGHWTLGGAAHFGAKLAASDSLSPLRAISPRVSSNAD